MASACNTSSDCLSVGVVRHCYETAAFSEETNFCDCSNWYGWSGERCDQPTGQLYYWRFSLIFTAAWSLALLLAYLYILMSNVKRTVDDKQFRVLLTVAGWFSLAVLMVLLTAMLPLRSAFDSSQFRLLTFQTFNGDEEFTVIASNGEVVFYTQSLALVFSLYGSMFIILSWINVLKQSAKYFPTLFSRGKALMTRFLKFFVSMSFIVMVVLVALRDFGLLFLFSGIVLLVTLGIYSYLTLAFIRTLSRVADMSQDRSFDQAVTLVKKSFGVLFACMLLALTFIVTHQVVSVDYFSKLEIGQFNYMLLFLDLATWTALLTATFALWYLQGRLYAHSKSATKPQTSTHVSAKKVTSAKANV